MAPQLISAITVATLMAINPEAKHYAPCVTTHLEKLICGDFVPVDKSRVAWKPCLSQMDRYLGAVLSIFSFCNQ